MQRVAFNVCAAKSATLPLEKDQVDNTGENSVFNRVVKSPVVFLQAFTDQPDLVDIVKQPI